MKKFIIGFLVLIAALVIGVVVFITTFDINSYKTQIENALRDATGYAFSLKGKISVSRSLEPIIIVDNVEIKNANGFKEPLFFSAKKAQISLNLKSLLKDVIVIHAVQLTDVEVNLEVLKDGRNNWTPSVASTSNSAPVANVKPSLKKNTTGKKTANVASVLMTNLNVFYRNEKTGEKLGLVFPKLSVQQLINFTGDVIYHKEKFSFSGSVKNLLAILATQRNLNFSFDVESSFVKGKISGVCRDLKACENDMTLNLNASGKDLQKAYTFFMGENETVPALPFTEQTALRFLQSMLLMEGTFSFPEKGIDLSYNIEQNLVVGDGKGHVELNVTGAELAHSYGVEPFSFKTNYTLSADKVLEFSNASAMFDETDIDGVVRVALSGKRPQIDAALRSHYFKLTNIIYQPEMSTENTQTAEADEVSEKLFSDKVFDLTFLNKVNGNVNIDIENLGVGNAFLRYPRLSLSSSLNDGILTTRLNEGSSFVGGNTVGKAVLDVTNVVPALTLDFVAQGLKPNQVNAWRKIFRSGDININLFLNSTGNSVASLLGNLNGDALFMANQIDISSPIVGDLLSEDAATGLSRMSQELFIKCAVLNLSAKDGVILLSKKAALETGKFNMIIDGDINLKNETLDLHFIPQRNKAGAEAISNVLKGVALDGSLSNPKPRVEVDVSAILPPPVVPAKVSDKQAFLNAYTKKSIEDNSVCRTALGTTVFKDIDAYFGRNLTKEGEVKEVKVAAPKKTTRAQKIGREFLDSLSDALSQAAEVQSQSGAEPVPAPAEETPAAATPAAEATPAVAN